MLLWSGYLSKLGQKSYAHRILLVFDFCTDAVDIRRAVQWFVYPELISSAVPFGCCTSILHSDTTDL
jgi:hypothetical protein